MKEIFTKEKKHDSHFNKLDLKQIKPTQLKNNICVYPPIEATKESEAAILVQEQAIRKCMYELYNTNPESKSPGLSAEELTGRDKLKEIIKQGEIIITYTDKDSRTVICKPETYKEAANIHLNKDTPVTHDLIEPTITKMNRLSRQIVKIFNIGTDNNDKQTSRITQATTFKDTNSPPVSFQWKTHKTYDTIPPT